MNLKNACFLLTLLWSVMLIVPSCTNTTDSNGSLMSPTSPGPADLVVPDPNPTQPTALPEPSSECGQIGLNRSSVRTKTECDKGVSFYVEATGATYFNIHLGGLNNGRILGPNNINEWSEWYLLDPGTYTYTVAAEKKLDDGSVIQCDYHGLSFTIDECYVDPKCPPGAYFNIELTEPENLVAVTRCPDSYLVHYQVNTNLAEFDFSYPAAYCSPNDNKSGVCKLQPNEEHVFEGSCAFGDLTCGSDRKVFYRECTPCSACVEFPRPYQRDDGNVFLPDLPGPMFWLVDGQPAAEQVVRLEPECEETVSVTIELLDSTCGEPVQCGTWEFEKGGPSCMTCEDIDLDPDCYDGNIDTEAHFKSYFDIPSDVCITRIRHDGSSRFSCTMSPIDAKWVVVKGGNGFRLYQNVSKWDWLCTYCCGAAGTSSPETHGGCSRHDISHISYFDCCR